MVKAFATQESKSHGYLSFEQNKELATLFAKSLSPDVILRNLSLYFSKEIIAEDHLFIFDEIQEAPDALNGLKYFAESKNQYHIVAAGSLLGVKLTEKGFPLGQVQFVDIFPKSFLEFLSVFNKEKLLPKPNISFKF